MDVETKNKVNITAKWDGTVEGFIWGAGEDKSTTKIYFNAPFEGTEQLFDIIVPENGPVA